MAKEWTDEQWIRQYESNCRLVCEPRMDGSHVAVQRGTAFGRQFVERVLKARPLTEERDGKDKQ